MKYNTIIVRYSEIFLKSNFVRNQLEKKLSDNIKNGIKRKEIEAKLTRETGRIFIETKQMEKITDLLKHIFGIVSFSLSVKLDLKDLEKFIKENCKDMLPRKTFAVRVSRTGNHDFTSQELAAKIGEIIIDITKKRVDLKNPDDKVLIEVRDQNTYIYTEKIAGPGGIPLGSQGKVNCLINSPESLVACWLMMKRGCVPEIYYTIPVDILGNWSYGNALKKIKAKNIENDFPLVLGDNLEKDGIEKVKEHGKEFKTILTPVIALKKEEIDDFLGKINK